MSGAIEKKAILRPEKSMDTFPGFRMALMVIGSIGYFICATGG